MPAMPPVTAPCATHKRGKYKRTLPPLEVRVRISNNGKDYIDAELSDDESIAPQCLFERQAAPETTQVPAVGAARTGDVTGAFKA